MTMKLGKPSPQVMSETIFRYKGVESRTVLVGPRPGVDVSVIDMGGGQVMIVNCDPISFIPHLGPKDSAVMSINEVASDVATSGIAPSYAMFDLNLPPQFSDSLLMAYWRSIHHTCKDRGLSIVGGHTGRFEGCDYSIVGSATMWTTAKNNAYLTSRMASNGDDLIFTKTAAYGATSVLTRAFPRTVRKHLGKSLFEQAWKYLRGTDTVDDSLSAVKAGIHQRGVTALHDVTEGGSLAGIVEMAEASNLGGVIDLESIPVSEETLEICKLFHIDPLTSLGEGSLLIASRPDRTKRVVGILRSRGTMATVIGQLSSRTRGLIGVSREGRFRISYPKRDPYWNAYWRAVRKGWS
jgi:hydrogenase expression/formation protein HypE